MPSVSVIISPRVDVRLRVDSQSQLVQFLVPRNRRQEGHVRQEMAESVSIGDIDTSPSNPGAGLINQLNRLNMLMVEDPPGLTRLIGWLKIRMRRILWQVRSQSFQWSSRSHGNKVDREELGVGMQNSKYAPALAATVVAKKAATKRKDLFTKAGGYWGPRFRFSDSSASARIIGPTLPEDPWNPILIHSHNVIFADQAIRPHPSNQFSVLAVGHAKASSTGCGGF
ncbi:hypothetical protein GGX14DRAFT_407604 [Mycena pura]|uniref:Uncharacterized protein n=1 Tax=Mycena pura TaxID=153505 RepID=A0AAD6UMK3_9AGAR|nr:hypothetical protein GGX14DRAFT_407604 [Mycena pura]